MYAAAISLFVEKGFDNTTMDDIAERADVARATVFNHFPRKAAFIDEWTARRRERAAVALRIDDLESAPLRRQHVAVGGSREWLGCEWKQHGEPSLSIDNGYSVTVIALAVKSRHT